LLDALTSLLDTVHSTVFVQLVQPLIFALGLTTHAEVAFDSTRLVLLGVCEIVLLVILLGTAQKLWPAYTVTDKAAVRTDIVYTLLSRLGGTSLLLFFLLQPLADSLEAALRLQGFSAFSLDAIWPGITDHAVASFAIYLLAFDAVDYLLHRAQHRFQWMWELHAVHHSQRQMTYWSDDRNHLIDDIIRGALFAVLGIALGVPPAQFVAVLMLSRVLQSIQHANIRLPFGPFLERVLVSPSFHRRHHAIGFGHEGKYQGCNFGVLFPCWDMLLRTADFRPEFVETGIRDQLSGRDYGTGFWAQQWKAIARIAGRA
jgi:sterol desaturase/sphingolipid hydroxylase (fatty acid hydroxylase superfamily)